MDENDEKFKFTRTTNHVFSLRNGCFGICLPFLLQFYPQACKSLSSPQVCVSCRQQIFKYMNDLEINNAGGGDEDDFCRGYGAQTNEGFDEGFEDNHEYDDTNENYIDEAEIDDKAPEMPQHFYKDVESFLMMAPPKLKETGTKKVKNAPKAPPVGVQLPDIYSNKLGGGESGPPRPPVVASKVRSKLHANTNKTKTQTQFDHSLLREAFAYTDKLLKEAIIEEAAAGGQAGEYGEHDGSRQPAPRGSSKKLTGKSGSAGAAPQGKPLASRTAPIESVYMAPHTDHQGGSGNRKKGDGAGKDRKSVVKRMRAKIPSEAAMYGANNDTEGTFNVSNDLDSDNRRNPINFDELISNFQGGVTLQKLRKELEQSKQSMKNSENFMRQLSMEYLGSGRF